MSLEYWDEIHGTNKHARTVYDGWLDKYHTMWHNAKNIIDLGCGGGVNSIFLHSQGVVTIACDFSKKALAQVKEALPETQTMCFDISDGLPFNDNFSGLVIADLSLHYFKTADTIRILQDISRVLRVNGYLLCRINSTEEFEKNENKSNNIEIEPGVFESSRGIKHFFNRADIETYLVDFHIENLFQTPIHKYGGCKYAWEVCARK